MIFYAVSHDRRRGSLYTNGTFDLLHRSCGTEQRRCHVVLGGREMASFSGETCLQRAMAYCVQHARTIGYPKQGAVSQRDRCVAPDAADKGASCLGQQYTAEGQRQPQYHGMESTSSSAKRTAPAVGAPPPGAGM